MDTKKIIKDSYPSSEKIYIPGKLFPIQVGMRKINLTDTVTVENGKASLTLPLDNNKVYFDGTIDEAEAQGYSKCQNCFKNE